MPTGMTAWRLSGPRASLQQPARVRRAGTRHGGRCGAWGVMAGIFSAQGC